MKSAVRMFLLTLLAFLFAGCQAGHPDPTAAHGRVVTEITITRESDQVSHHYTEQRSMARILSYLRRLKPYGKVEDCPEVLSRENYRITVTLSDGSQQLYRQLDRRYFLDARRQWRQIDPDAAEELSLLFEAPDETNVFRPVRHACPAFCSGKCPAFPSHSPGSPGSPGSASRWPYAG